MAFDVRPNRHTDFRNFNTSVRYLAFSNLVPSLKFGFHLFRGAIQISTKGPENTKVEEFRCMYVKGLYSHP